MVTHPQKVFKTTRESEKEKENVANGKITENGMRVECVIQRKYRIIIE